MDEKLLRQLRCKIGKEWFLLGCHLGFSEAQMEHLQSTFPYNIPRCICTMLSRWNEIVTKTKLDGKELLKEALTNVGRLDLAQELDGSQQNQSGLDEVDGPHQTKTRTGSDSGSQPASLPRLLKQISFKRNSRKIDDYIDQSEQYLEHKLKEKHLFVPTRAYKRSEDLYRSHHIVTVLGNPGDGKTMIAAKLLQRLRDEGENVVVLADPSLMEQLYESNTHVVFFVDDAFGTPTINKSLVETWARFYDKLESLIEARKCGLILTSRKQVFTQCRDLLYKCNSIAEQIVDISTGPEQYSHHERTLIAAKYLSELMQQGYFLTVPVTKYIPGFPLMCKMYATNKDLCGKASEYFDNPIVFFKQQIEHLLARDVSSYCGLTLLTMFDGKLSKDVLDYFESHAPEITAKSDAVLRCCGLNPTNDKAKVERSLESMVGVYIDYDYDNEEYFFLHDSIFDAVCFVFGQQRPKEILKVASSDFVERRVRTQGALYNTDENDVIILPKGRYKDLAERWIKDMKAGHLSSVYDNPSFKDDYMNAIFMNRLRCLSDDEIWHMMNMSDKKRGKTYISLACEAEFESLVVLSINQLLESGFSPSRDVHTDVLLKAFLELVTAGHSNALEALLSMKLIDIDNKFLPTKRQAVHFAVLNGNSNVLQILLDNNADVTSRDEKGALPMHYASEIKNPDCLNILLSQGKKVMVFDSNGCQPSHYAANSGSLECLQRLLMESEDITVTDLSERELIHFAATNADEMVLEFLIEKGANVNKLDGDQRTPLHHACMSALIKNITILLKSGANPEAVDRQGNLPIHYLCGAYGSQKTIVYMGLCVLLQKSTVVNVENEEKQTPLHLASSWQRNRSNRMVSLLLDKGANPDVVDIYGNYPVINACAQGSFDTVRILLRHGASKNVVDSCGKGLLHYAAMRSHLDGWQYLEGIEESDLNTIDDDGKRPLHLACQYGNEVFTRHLLENGAELNCQDKLGMTPLHHACRWNKVSIVKILVENEVDAFVKDNTGRLPVNLLPSWNMFSKSCVQITELLTSYMQQNEDVEDN